MFVGKVLFFQSELPFFAGYLIYHLIWSDLSKNFICSLLMELAIVLCPSARWHSHLEVNICGTDFLCVLCLLYMAFEFTAYKIIQSIPLPDILVENIPSFHMFIFICLQNYFLNDHTIPLLDNFVVNFPFFHISIFFGAYA